MRIRALYLPPVSLCYQISSLVCEDDPHASPLKEGSSPSPPPPPPQAEPSSSGRGCWGCRTGVSTWPETATSADCLLSAQNKSGTAGGCWSRKWWGLRILKDDGLVRDMKEVAMFLISRLQCCLGRTGQAPAWRWFCQEPSLSWWPELSSWGCH